MPQTYQDVPANTTLQNSRPRLLERDDTLRSSFSGVVFPSAPVAGQLCYRSDLDRLYRWSGTAWVLQPHAGAAGATLTFATRAALEAFDPVSPALPAQTRAHTLGRLAAGDGGGAIWRWEPTSTTAGGALVVRPAVGTASQAANPGRWLLDAADPSVTLANTAEPSLGPARLAIAGGGAALTDFLDAPEGHLWTLERGGVDVTVVHDAAKIDLGGANLTLTTATPRALFLHAGGVHKLVGAGVGSQNVAQLANVTALRALTTATVARVAVLDANWTAGDGGGLLVRDAADTSTADDGGAVIVDAAGRRWKRHGGGPVNLRWWNAPNDLSADCAPALSAACVFAGGAGRGGVVWIPAGFYQLAQLVTISNPVVLRGEGAGMSSGTGYSGGSVLRASFAAGDVLRVRARGAVELDGVTMDASVTRTSGAFLNVRGDGVQPYNTQLRVQQCQFQGGWDAIVLDAVNEFAVRDCKIVNYRNVGIDVGAAGWTGSNNDQEAGHSVIDHCTIWDLTVGTSRACVVYRRGGDVRIVNNKLLRSNYGVEMALSGGPTGTLIVANNSMEQQWVNCVRIAQAASGANYGNVQIVGNQLSVIEDATVSGIDPQSAIHVVAGTAGAPETCWLRNVVIVGNVVNHVITPSVPRCAVQVDDGEALEIDNNVIHFNGRDANNFGFGVGANARDVAIGSNRVRGLVGAGRKYRTLTSETRLLDFDGVAFADLPVCANGSLLRVTDGAVDSVPLTGGGAGTIGLRLGNAWRSLVVTPGAGGGGGSDPTRVAKTGDTMSGALVIEVDGVTNQALLRLSNPNVGSGAGVSIVTAQGATELHRQRSQYLSGAWCWDLELAGSRLVRATSARTEFEAPIRPRAYTVAALPSGAAGDVSYATNGRKNGEGSGAGTGVPVFHDGSAWRAVDTGATVAA